MKQTWQRKGGSVNRIVVRPRPGKPSQGLMNVGGRVFPCALGRGGITSNKREGDGATPLGPMRVLSAYIKDRAFIRASRLPLAPIRADLGWCDAPGDRNYNRPVALPYSASHETMRRVDHLYDSCIVLDWNMKPTKPGRGSAIFFHLARPGFPPTEGCVAVTPQVMARLLPMMSRQTVLEVRRG